MSLEILLIVQCRLQTRMLRNIVLIAVLLPIDNGTGQANMSESTNVLHEMTLRGKNNLFYCQLQLETDLYD